MSAVDDTRQAQVSFWNDPKTRSTAVQIIMVIALLAVGYELYVNASANLAKLGKTFGYEFWNKSSGFDILQSLIPYTSSSSYGTAIIVGFLNTLLVAVFGILLSTIIGFIAGIARLSKNWLVAKIATVYVETIRNIPLLLQIFIWYGAVLKPLPGPKQAIDIGGFYTGNFAVFVGILGFIIGALSCMALWRIFRDYRSTFAARLATWFLMAVGCIISFWIFMMIGGAIASLAFSGEGGGMFLSNRGLNMPSPVFGAGAWLGLTGLAVGIVAAVWLGKWSRARQAATGEIFPHTSVGIGLIVLLPILGLLVMGWPVTWDYPTIGGFNFSGGITVIPEFLALLIALSVYTGTFIAEIVRSGIQAISHGQTEAAGALGLRQGLTTRLVTIPQAMRIIIPPLASQYLNLTKNSSLAVAIAYPDLVAMGGTVLNQTGKAIEVMLIFMAVYLSLSLLTSSFMNWFNSRMKLVER